MILSDGADHESRHELVADSVLTIPWPQDADGLSVPSVTATVTFGADPAQTLHFELITEAFGCEAVLPNAPIDQDDTSDPSPTEAPTADTIAAEDELLDAEGVDDEVLDADGVSTLPRTGQSVPGMAVAAGLAIGLGAWLLRRRPVTVVADSGTGTGAGS